MTHNYIISEEERSWAAFAHLSGFAGYLFPFGGIILPIIIMINKSESVVISGIAKQAMLLNIFAFICVIIGAILFLTVVGIPIAIIVWIVASIGGFALPIIGTLKALDGKYFRYPFIG